MCHCKIFRCSKLHSVYCQTNCWSSDLLTCVFKDLPDLPLSPSAAACDATGAHSFRLLFPRFLLCTSAGMGSSFSILLSGSTSAWRRSPAGATRLRDWFEIRELEFEGYIVGYSHSMCLLIQNVWIGSPWFVHSVLVPFERRKLKNTCTSANPAECGVMVSPRKHTKKRKPTPLQDTHLSSPSKCLLNMFVWEGWEF